MKRNSPTQNEIVRTGKLDLEKRPDLFKSEYKKGSWLFLLCNKSNFIDHMMILNRKISHLSNEFINLDKILIEARDEWYIMYGDIWENNWSLTKNYIAIAAIIITTLNLIN